MAGTDSSTSPNFKSQKVTSDENYGKPPIYGSLAADNSHLETSTKLIGRPVADISSYEISMLYLMQLEVEQFDLPSVKTLL